METPILDFLRAYVVAGMSRFHMPGHKGCPVLGCEALDITEVQGADSLYEADGIIARSEANATAIFGSQRTLFSTEGSSQCIRAMLYLALQHRPLGAAPLILAARNVHKAFVFAAALLDFEVEWLWPESGSHSLCSCPVTPQALEKALASLPVTPAAVYLTSPDYLGCLADIAVLAKIAHAHGCRLLVDNAHGAYLHFLEQAQHPLDLGADLCCDSAHKTLPVLTGGAYLHIGKAAPAAMAQEAKTALALFGSTSPSYLTMASLDACNQALAGEEVLRIRQAAARLAALKADLQQQGWVLRGDEALKVTIDGAASGWSGLELAELLRSLGLECEYADPESLVLMVSGHTIPEDFQRVAAALGKNCRTAAPGGNLPLAKGERAMSIRQTIFSPHECIPVEQALGRICAAPTVACPPAIPIAVSGEIISEAALSLFRHYSVDWVDVVKQN